MSELLQTTASSTRPSAGEAAYYRPAVKWLHWLSAMIIVWASISGLYVSFFPTSEALKFEIGFINVSLTTVFIPFFIVRVICRFGYRSDAVYQQAPVVKALHLLMYGLTGTVLASGFLMMSKPIDVFHWMLIPHLIHDVGVQHLFETAHDWSCRLLSAIVALHIAAVIKHQFSDTPVLRKML